jgi:ABC-2 type transport system permease protein
MKAYLSVFRLRRRLETQYRGAVLGGVICQMFFGIILIAVYRALYAGKPQDYPFTKIASYVWLQQAFFRMLVASDPDLLDKIRTGGIAYDLCRPLNLYGFYYVRIMAQKIMGSLLRAVPMLVFAVLLPEGWGLLPPASTAGFSWSLAGLLLGLLCVSTLENITMGFTMRTLDSRGMQALLNLLMMIFAGNILPLTLFPDSWQRVITLLPYAQLLDAPIRLNTGDVPPAAAGRILLIQALWTAALTGLGYWLWQRHQKRLVVQGG